LDHLGPKKVVEKLPGCRASETGTCRRGDAAGTDRACSDCTGAVDGKGIQGLPRSCNNL